MQDPIRTVATAAILLCIHAAPGAQPADSAAAKRSPSPFGIGIAAGGALVAGGNEIVYLPADLTNLRFPLALGDAGRIEPEVGYFTTSRSFSDSRGHDYESKFTNLRVSLGILKLSRSGSTQYQYGVRAGLIRTTQKSGYTVSGETRSKNDYFVGPEIGAEYMLDEHFSVGAEAGINYAHIGDLDDSEDDVSEWFISTRTSVVVRWFY